MKTYLHKVDSDGVVLESSFIIDIEGSSEERTLDAIGEAFEMLDEIIESNYNAIFEESVDILEESIDNIKGNLKKAWDRLVAWFKELVVTIKKKLRGHYDNMNVEVTKSSDGEVKIKFYKNVVGVIKTFTLDTDEKYEFLNASQVVKILTTYNKKIGQFKTVKKGSEASRFTKGVDYDPDASDVDMATSTKNKLRDAAAGTKEISADEVENIRSSHGLASDVDSKNVDDIAFVRSQYYMKLKNDETAVKNWASNFTKNYGKIIKQIYGTSDKIDKKFSGKPGNRQAYNVVKNYRGIVNKLVRINNIILKIDND